LYENFTEISTLKFSESETASLGRIMAVLGFKLCDPLALEGK
jgi:hypothetical protein